METALPDRAVRVPASSAWRNDRWDSFCLVTPNWTVQLPGKAFSGDDPAGFMAKPALLEYLDDWVASFRPPLHAPVEVLHVRPRSSGRRQTGAAEGEGEEEGGFEVRTSEGTVTAEVVVVATATYQRPRRPAVALPAALPQLHVVDYKRPAQLPPGRVLVIGAGQSGCHVVEDLLRAGRQVSLAVGRCRTLPRRYRGRDVIDWQNELGLLDRKPSALDDPALRFSPGDPQMTGRDGGRTTVRLAELEARGVQLHGRLRGCGGSSSSGGGGEDQQLLRFDGRRSVLHAAAEADRFLLAFIAQVDAHCAGDVVRDPPPPPPLEPEDHALIAAAQEAVREADESAASARGDRGEDGSNGDDERHNEPPQPRRQQQERQEEEEEEEESQLPLSEVSCVVWATGFDFDFSWLEGFDEGLLDAAVCSHGSKAFQQCAPRIIFAPTSCLIECLICIRIRTLIGRRILARFWAPASACNGDTAVPWFVLRDRGTQSQTRMLRTVPAWRRMGCTFVD